MVGFLVGFCVFFRFEAIFRPVDQANHSQHPGDAFERLGGSSGAQLWPDFQTFVVRMVVLFVGEFLCVLDLSSLRTDAAPSIRVVIHNTQVVLLNARVTVL